MNSNKKQNSYWQDVAQDKKVQEYMNLKFASWNIRTMLDRGNADRPERRSAIVAGQLANYNIDIAALSEVRFADSGSIREEAGYTIFWSGKPEGETHEYGVGLAIRNGLIPRLMGEPQPVNERMMTLRLPLTQKRYCTIISIYAPTMTNTAENISRFYSQLNETLGNISNSDKIILLGDFNARIGKDHNTWENVIGNFGTGKCNTNGQLLLETCTEHQLVITNTCFKHKDAHKHSWMHPRSKHWHLIDYIITRQRDLHDFLDTRAVRGANCSTDHIMIRSSTKLKIRSLIKKKGKQPHRKLDISKLKNEKIRSDLESAINDQLVQVDGTLEEKWSSFRDTVYKASFEKLGSVIKRHEDWFDENSSELNTLIVNRNKSRVENLNRSTRSTKARLRHHNRLLQRRCRELKNQWWQGKAAELQVFADTNNVKGFYQSMKAVWGPKLCFPDQLLATDGRTLITNKQDLLDRWTTHFRTLLNDVTDVDTEIANRITQSPVQLRLDDCPDIGEVKDAIDMLCEGKSPGPDGIHPEIVKRGGIKLVEILYDIIVEAWHKSEVPQDWKDAQLITIFKKGNRKLCGNYRGISLLSIPGKVFARVLLNRLTSVAEDFLPEAQCGFRVGRGTTDMIFSLKQIQEKCIEQRMPLYMVFVDFTKAFDTVNRSLLWIILKKIGCPEKFVNLIASLHNNMRGQIRFKGEVSDAFEISNGVKQGCVLAPTLFSIFLFMVLSHAFDNNNQGVWIQSRPGADLFNVNQYKSTKKTQQILVRELMFADDTAFVAHSHQDAQEIITLFAQAARTFGLKINIKKTEVVYQPVPGSQDTGDPILLNGEDLAQVTKFRYLGSTVSNNNSLEIELELRTSNASRAFGRLKERVWNNRDLTLTTKCAVYKAIVLSTLLYGSETWTVYRAAAHKLNAYMMRHLRMILKIKWWHLISNATVLEKTNMRSMYEILTQRNLRWSGHVNRMENTRLPKRILYSQLREGSRGVGRPKLRFKDVIKRSLRDTKISIGGWQKLSNQRDRWRSMIYGKPSSSKSTDS